jgi:tRNA A-37 threonylcarbamoyl transferase component Bud32
MVRPAGIGYSISDFSRACLIRLIDYPEMPLRISTRETIKVGRSALLVRADLPVGSGMIPVVYKRINRRNWFKKLTALPRQNRALRTWQKGHALRARGIRTPEPFAVIVPHRLEVNRPSYIALEWIEDSQNLDAYCNQIATLANPARSRRFRAAAQSLGELLGRMHAGQVSHRDLKPGNLLIVERHDQVVPYVIDLDGAEIRGQLSERQRVQNLARLAIGITTSPAIGYADCLRFLKAYLHELGADVRAWKPLWKQLAARSEDLAARKSRKAA